MKINSFLPIAFFILPLYAEHLPNFEKEFSSDCIVDAKQIKIPGYPDAFNPSIIRLKDYFLLSFRTIYPRSSKDKMKSCCLEISNDVLLSAKSKDPESPCIPSSDGCNEISMNSLFNCSGEDGESPCLYRKDFIEAASDDCALSQKEEVSDPPSYSSGIPNREAFLLSFRVRDPKTLSTNKIGLVLLNENLEIISWPQILNIYYDDPSTLNRQQDPRLITINDRIWMVYSNILGSEEPMEIRRMFMVELIQNGDTFSAGTPVAILEYEGEKAQRWEKNWVPFEYNNELHLAYSINPHLIFKPDTQRGNCSTISSTFIPNAWNVSLYGVARGGTPALLINDEEYLAVFHSSVVMKSIHSDGKKIQHYFMVPYTFQSRPPFALSRIAKKPIANKNFYSGASYPTWKPLRVVFPGGLMFKNESQEEYAFVLYGYQDHETWMAKIKKDCLLESLSPLETPSEGKF